MRVNNLITELVIKRARSEHAELVAPLFDRHRQFYGQSSDVLQARSFMLERRLTKGDSVLFLAVSNEAAVGFTQLYPSFSSVSMRRLWILNDLFVSPPARKLGVGAALLERARQFAVETGAKGLVLETANDNPA